MTDYDAIVIGAGTNGLATAKVLANHGLKVINLEKNDFVGGIAGCRELWDGYRSEIGATFLFPIVDQIKQELELEKYGLEYVDTPIMSVNIIDKQDKPFILYSDIERQWAHMIEDFGEDGANGFMELVMYCQFPASLMDRFNPRQLPKSMAEVFASAGNEVERQQIYDMYFSSAMDLVDRFLPDPVKHRGIRAMMSFMAVQSTYRGPYSPGSAFCLMYALANSGTDALMRKVKGGMGSISECLQRAIEAKGGKVELKAQVERILVENGKAIGVRLKNGDELRAKIIISNLDKQTTFFDLAGEEHFDTQFRQKINRIQGRGAYLHILWRLNSVPEFGKPWEYLNSDINHRSAVSRGTDPKVMQSSWHDCEMGRVPAHPPTSLQIASICDPTLVPPGSTNHVANSYIFYYPCSAPQKERGKLKDEMAEIAINRIAEAMPDFRDCIDKKIVFASDHFTTMTGSTGGDFCHGLLHPEEMLEFRKMVPDSANATPIGDLYICGSSTHPGPGVTFVPGYNCAYEVLEKRFGLSQREGLAQAN
jgi:phytoene dehydrogenase-like protein